MASMTNEVLMFNSSAKPLPKSIETFGSSNTQEPFWACRPKPGDSVKIKTGITNSLFNPQRCKKDATILVP